MHNLQKVWHCTIADYVQWLTNSRQILMVILLIFNYILAVNPLLDRAKQMKENIGFLEPFIAIGSSGVILLILPVIFLILVSDFPRSQGNSLLRLHRIGRKNWLVAQIFQLFIIIVTYLIIIAVGAIIPILGHCSFTLQWSRIVTEYAILYPESSGSYELLPENLYYQIENPLYAMLHTYGLMMLYLFLLGMILLTSSLYQHRKAGNAIAAFLIVGGATLCSMHSKWMWCFPMAHTVTWLHFTKYFRQPVLPLWISYLLLVGCSLLLLFMSMFAVRRFAFDAQEE